MTLDSVQGCMKELADINEEVQKFSWVWAQDAGLLKQKLTLAERLHRSALLKTSDSLKVAERNAVAWAAVEVASPGLQEEIDELEYKVEKAKTLFRTLERRSENARSILSALKAETRMGS